MTDHTTSTASFEGSKKRQYLMEEPLKAALFKNDYNKCEGILMSLRYKVV